MVLLAPDPNLEIPDAQLRIEVDACIARNDEEPHDANPRRVIIVRPCGARCAATMRAAGLGVLVLEKAGQVARCGGALRPASSAHRPHHSGLPGMPMPPDYPAYPSRRRWSPTSKATRPAFRSAGLHHQSLAPPHHGARWLADTPLDVISARVVVVATALRTRRTVRPGLDRTSIRARSLTAATIEIPRRIPAGACSSSFRQFRWRDRA